MNIYQKVEILDAGAEGKAVARIGDRVVFVPFVVPGDVVDIEITRHRKQFWEGKALHLHTLSSKRTEPFCSHFGTCGGCRWQNMDYTWQLFYKQKQVSDQLERIGKFEEYELSPILPSALTRSYRNKLEFTFSGRGNALGFHLPGRFDTILDISTCHLQEDPSNAIRLAAKRYSQDQGHSFHDPRSHTGMLRNLLIRSTASGDVMIIVVIGEDRPDVAKGMLDVLAGMFPQICSGYYVINLKHNDAIQDLPFHLHCGSPWIHETMKAFDPGQPDVVFRIGPASFFQTNTTQAAILYRTVAGFGDFRGDEIVYDLYSGTGTISCYLARNVKQVIGIESVHPAVQDAIINAELNGIRNAVFIPGEVEKVLEPGFTRQYGIPDIIITDPPRAGMHPDAVQAIRDLSPRKVIYVSCNPATQARDMMMLRDQFTLVRCQPVDMFPHTHHVENVALLENTVRRISSTG